MRKFIIILISLLICVSCLFSCKKSSSYFSIQFIDVGQGDSALVECDGRYMLIDGGSTSARDKVCSVLEEKGVQKLDILAISHLHNDHFGGLTKALKYAQDIKKVISNADYTDVEEFDKFNSILKNIGAPDITIPHKDDVFYLGSAKIEILYSSNDNNNDSLVMLITYGDTRFLFTGDIEEKAQKIISEDYKKQKGKSIDLMKIPHHGAENSLFDNVPGINYSFLDVFKPKYGIISVGTQNGYGHPAEITLDRLEDAEVEIYRTDVNGDIFVKSNGKIVKKPHTAK